jgi:acyl-CoA synthetase (AMP-forming)/AMP-acid ligase II
MAPCFAFDLCTRRTAVRTADPLDLSSWRVAICGGEAVRPHLLEKFAAAFDDARFDPKAFMPAYGLAEATLLATCGAPGRGLIGEAQQTGGAPRSFACCGLPAPGQTLAIVDPVSRRRLPDGQTGEIWLAGGGIARGYWSRPEETEAAFRAVLADEPESGFWLRTGDLGFLSGEGLIVTGRLKEVIVIRGANYNPLDIEAVARDSDPALSDRDGGAFSVDRDSGEVVVLVHEIDRSAAGAADLNGVAGNIVEAVSRTLGLALYDLVLLRAGSLPRTTSGKIQRHQCKELYLAGGLAALSPVDHPGLGRFRPQPHEPA